MSAINVYSFFIDCPYCNFRNKIGNLGSRTNIDQYGMNIHCCDLEEGGCDNYFAYKLDIKVQSQSYKIDTVSKEVQ